MIDFRYHLVSIVAVFLALAIGIVLGSTELQGNTIDVLRTSSNPLKNELDQSNAQRDTAQQQVSTYQTFLDHGRAEAARQRAPGRPNRARHRARRLVGGDLRRQAGGRRTPAPP